VKNEYDHLKVCDENGDYKQDEYIKIKLNEKHKNKIENKVDIDKIIDK